MDACQLYHKREEEEEELEKKGLLLRRRGDMKEEVGEQERREGRNLISPGLLVVASLSLSFFVAASRRRGLPNDVHGLSGQEVAGWRD